MSGHVHRESRNPRNAGWCDCGHRMFRDRNAPLEVEIVEEACRGHVDPDALIDHAQRRANQFGPQVRVGMDWLWESLEEGPDSVNYLCWDLEEHFDADGRDELMAAIAEITSAYERVRRVRERRREQA